MTVTGTITVTVNMTVMIPVTKTITGHLAISSVLCTLKTREGKLLQVMILWCCLLVDLLA